MATSQDNCGSSEQSIPQWKRELILRRRAITRTLPAGSSSVQLTCPSVVTAVRLAESVAGAAGENVSDYQQQQRYSAPIASSKTNSLDQQATYFHPRVPSPSSSSTAGSSVAENMRLVEHESVPGLRRSLPIGVDLDSNKTIDALAYRSIMGEEKSVKKSCASNRKMENNNAVKGVLGENNNGNHANGGECLSDSSEELQYGPGIVNKLKSKYMSMTLRETKNKRVRPSLSQLRRAASMENMLDDNDSIDKGKPPLIKQQHKFTKRTEVTSNTTNKYQTQHQQRYRSYSRGNDSIKRARSVEALLCYETKPQVPASQLPSPIESRKHLLKSLSKDDIIIVEKSIPSPPVEKPPIPQLDAARKKRPTMNGTQKTGLPPPDLVKQTLKLFESSQQKPVPVNSLVKASGPPTVAKLNINAANKPVPGSNKPLLSPKPSPEKIRRSPLMKVPVKKVSLPPKIPVSAVVAGVEAASPAPQVQVPLPAPSIESPVHRKEQAPPIPELQIQRKLPQPPTSIEIPRMPPTTARDALRSPITPPSRVLPLDLKPTQLVSNTFSQSSPKLLKSPSLTAIPVVSPTNGVSKLSPVKSRTPSPLARSRSPLQHRASSPDIKPFSMSPEIKPRTYVVTPKTTSPEAKPRTVSPLAYAQINSPVLIARTPSPLANGKPIVQDQGMSSDDEDTADGCVNKNISTSSLENIRKSGSTEVFTFCTKTASDKSKSHLPANASQSSPRAMVTLQDKNAPSPPARHPNPMFPLPATKSPEMPSTKQVGIIRPIVNSGTKVTSTFPSPLTDREKEKNHINSVKSSTEQPTKVIASIKTSEVVVGNVSEALKGRLGIEDTSKGLKEVKSLREKVNANSTGLWDNQKQQNVMKFNFTNRKDTPDYIENAGITLRPERRQPIRPGDSGFIILDPSLEESSATEEADDFCTGFLGPPSPCNVLFEGDNIVINGKSSLRGKSAKKKLRIKFNDEATQLFEYPSESSLLNDLINSTASTSVAGLPPPPAGPTPGLPVPSGGSSLASYTSKVSMGTEDFQLGVTRTTPLPKPKEAVDQSASTASSVDDNVAWSTDTADDLLF